MFSSVTKGGVIFSTKCQTWAKKTLTRSWSLNCDSRPGLLGQRLGALPDPALAVSMTKAIPRCLDNLYRTRLPFSKTLRVPVPKAFPDLDGAPTRLPVWAPSALSPQAVFLSFPYYQNDKGQDKPILWLSSLINGIHLCSSWNLIMKLSNHVIRVVSLNTQLRKLKWFKIKAIICTHSFHKPWDKCDMIIVQWPQIPCWI